MRTLVGINEEEECTIILKHADSIISLRVSGNAGPYILRSVIRMHMLHRDIIGRGDMPA